MNTFQPIPRLRLVLLSLTVLAIIAPPAFAGPSCEKLDDCPCVFDMVESSLGRGWVGIYMENEGGEGWVVTEVVPDGPAHAAGLTSGDKLVAMNGVPMVKEYEAKLSKIYKTMVPGAKLVYTVERNGKKQDVEVTLGRLPKKILAIILGQQLLESYAMITGEELEHKDPPPAPKPPSHPEGKKPPAPKADGGR